MRGQWVRSQHQLYLLDVEQHTPATLHPGFMHAAKCSSGSSRSMWQLLALGLGAAPQDTRCLQTPRRHNNIRHQRTSRRRWSGMMKVRPTYRFFTRPCATGKAREDAQCSEALC